jgi:hypothetical protein
MNSCLGKQWDDEDLSTEGFIPIVDIIRSTALPYLKLDWSLLHIRRVFSESFNTSKCIIRMALWWQAHIKGLFATRSGTHKWTLLQRLFMGALDLDAMVIYGEDS